MNLLKDDNGVAFGIVGESGSSAKIYYSLKNQLMSEHQNIIDAPNSFEIPDEVNTIEKMNLYAKENGGILFFPTNSIADLKDDLHVNQEAILANSNTVMFLSRDAKLPCPDAFTNTNYNKDFLKHPKTCYGEITKKEEWKMKKIKQGQTIFVVEGSHKNNTFLHEVFVAKTYTSKVEESHLETSFKGIEEKEITEEQIKQATGIDKLFLVCSPRVRKLHVYEQEFVKTLKPHQIIEDIAGNAFDVNDSQFRVYMERKKALKDFQKTSKKSNLRFYESNTKESLFGDTHVVELHPSSPKCTIGVAYPSSLMDSDVLEMVGREGRKYGVQILIPAKNVCMTLEVKP